MVQFQEQDINEFIGLSPITIECRICSNQMGNYSDVTTLIDTKMKWIIFPWDLKQYQEVQDWIIFARCGNIVGDFTYQRSAIEIYRQNILLTHYHNDY